MDNEQLEISLTGMAYPGQAFGRDAAGRMIFTPFGLPDERVLVKILKGHKRWAQAQILKILDPSPNRISPKCTHYQECGGCHYQHLPYPMQLDVKANIIASQMERLGGIENPPVSPTVPSPMPWNYRNHLQFSLNQDCRLGFHAPQSELVVPIDECHLPDADLGDLWPRLDLTENPGLERISFRSGTNGEQMVIFHSEDRPKFELEVDLPASVVWLSQGGMLVLAGESYLHIEILGRPFRVSAGSFFQVNTSLAGELVHQALRLLNPQPHETILDLYAGVGLFSAFIAESAAHLIAIEESPWASEDFSINLDEFDDVELYEASVELALPILTTQVDKILVDPPRAGLDREVIKHLMKLSPEVLVYVSCDSATFARDAKIILESGYKLEEIVPLDLFPQTYHIETIALFSKTTT